jgi:hypothetical protein
MSKTLSGFTEETQLFEIIELLTLHGSLQGLDNVQIKLIMPKEMVETMSKLFQSIERFKLSRGIAPEESNYTIRKLYCTGGIVEIFSDEEAEIKLK